MARKKSTADWLSMIDTAQEVTRDYRLEYRTYVDYYRGIQWQARKGNRNSRDQQFIIQDMDAIVVNWIFSTIRTIVPTVFFKNPRIFPHATRDEFRDREKLVGLVTNYDWRILKIKNEMKRSILRSLIGGLSWLETGYSFLEEEVEAPTPTVDTDLTLEEQLAGGTAAEKDPQEDIGKQFTELRILKDEPFVLSRSILDVVHDPFANVLDEMGWYAIREVKPIEMIKRDPRFRNTRKLSSNFEMDEVHINKTSEEYRKRVNIQFGELWHVTDRWGGRTVTLYRGHKGPLREFDTPEGYDLVPIVFNEDPEATTHISIVGIIKDQQDEINRLRTFMLEHVKRTLPRMAYDDTTITDEEKVNRLANSDHLELIGVPGRPNDLIQAINFPSLSPDLYATDSRLKDDMQVGSGLSDFQRGQAVKVPSATEAQLIEQSSRLRVDESLDIVSDVAEIVTKNIFKLRQQFTQGEKIVPVIGEDQIPIWSELRTFTREEIQGDFEFVVEYGSTQKRDQDFQKNLWLQLAPILANLAENPTPSNIAIGRQLAKVHEIPTSILDSIFPPVQTADQTGLGTIAAPGSQTAGQAAPSVDDFIQALGGA